MIPDPATYADWFAQAEPAKRRLAVGVRRYAAAEKALGATPSWEHFVEPKTGRLLTLPELQSEEPGKRHERVGQVRQLIQQRGEQNRQVARFGFLPPTSQPPVAVPKPKQPAPFKPAESRADVAQHAAQFNSYMHPASPKPVTLEQHNAVHQELAKLPEQVHAAIKAKGGTIHLIADDGITSHPEQAHLKGKTPRGWEGTGYTWDNVPGVGPTRPGGATIIVANKLQTGHGSVNLVVHEHAHNYDNVAGFLSYSAEWQTIHKATDWPTAYEASHHEESFAESMAKYFHDARSRASLAPQVREFFDRHFA